MDPSVERVSEVWKEHWARSDMRPDTSLRGRLLLRYQAKFGGFSGARHILKSVLADMGDPRGKRVLDAGAGTGLNSLALAARGAAVTLLDIAPQALEIARSYYRQQGLEAEFVEGSIFDMPFPDGSFDLVWNTGVIEHFEPEVRRRAVREMLRLIKPDGVMITINPNAKARIYRFAKREAERRGTWDVGVELPIDTLEGDVDPGEYVLTEREEGWWMQLHFLKYLLPRRLRLPYAALHELSQNLLNFINRFPGYLRVSVVRRRPRST